MRSPVTNTRAVAARWAGRTDSRARSHNGAIYFEGPEIYSYGPHHLIGVIVPVSDFFEGPKGFGFVVLVNSDKASVTTSRHTGICAGEAARIYGTGRVIRVDGLTDKARKMNFRDCQNESPETNLKRLAAVFSSEFVERLSDLLPAVERLSDLRPAALSDCA